MEWLAPTVMASISDVPAVRQELNRARADNRRLRQRIASLETEIQETRRLNYRVAEVTDIVEQVLLPAADDTTDPMQPRLEKYANSL